MKMTVSIVVLGLVALVGGSRMGHVQCFRYYFNSITAADASMNPVQRALFSLVLAQSDHPQKKTGQDGHAALPHKRA